jgi:hypothetical protein
MGWGIGIGIGWPTTSSSSTPTLGYFSITGSCEGALEKGVTSQLIDVSTYNVGDYVNGIRPSGGIRRYILGSIQETPGIQIAELFGPAFTGCE